MSNDVKRVMDRVYAATKRRSYTEALLGRPNANGTISYAVDERPGFVHVRIGSAGSLTPDVARNVGKRAVAHRQNLPILLVRENGDWVIEGENTASGLLDDDDGSNNGPYGVPAHPHDHSELSGLADDDHPQYHNDARGDALYPNRNEFIDESAGAADAGKPVKTNPAGLVDSTMVDLGSAVDDAIAALTSDDIAEGATNLYISDVELIKLAGIETAADVTDAANVSPVITALATKTTLVDADAVVTTDSAASDAPKRTTWANIKATLVATALTWLNNLAINSAATSGSALSVTRNLASGSTDSAVASFIQDHPTDDQRAVDVRQDSITAEGLSVNTPNSTTNFAAQFGALVLRNTDPTDGNYTRINFNGDDGPAAAAAMGVKFVSHASDYGDYEFWTRGPAGNLKKLGIGNDGLIHITQPTLGDEIQRIESTATGDDPRESLYQNRIATTNATVTTLHTFTIPATTTYMVEAVVIARRTGGASGTAEDGAGYKLIATFKNVAGTATQIGATTVVSTHESQAGWDCVFDVTGATARIRVTGAASNNVSWHMTARVWQLGT